LDTRVYRIGKMGERWAGRGQIMSYATKTARPYFATDGKL
jgi:hypothetical protein